MQERRVASDNIEKMKYCGIHFEQWLSEFENIYESVQQNDQLLREYPSIP